MITFSKYFISLLITLAIGAILLFAVSNAPELAYIIATGIGVLLITVFVKELIFGDD